MLSTKPRTEVAKHSEFVQHGRHYPRDIIEQLSQSDCLLTAKELAKLLAVSPKTLYSYVSPDLIPHYKIEANVRFRGKEFAEWLRRHAD